MEVIFFISAAVIFYAYIGYPLLLLLLSRNQDNAPEGNRQTAPEDFPEVTVVLAAYNGGQRIGARLDNLLATDYPLEKLHIIVVSDGSTDKHGRCRPGL